MHLILASNRVECCPKHFQMQATTGKNKYYSGTIPTDYILKKGDIIVTMTDLSRQADTLGFSARVPEMDGVVWLHNQRVGLVKLKQNIIVDSDFLHYLLCTDGYRHWIVSSATGSTVKHTSPSRICEYEFYLPPINTQKSVGQILSALDNRISLLRETNTTLEAIAKTLFKSWFVDFDPVKAKAEGRLPEGISEATAALFPSEFEESALGLIPKGWKCSTLAEAYEINPQRKLKKGEIAPYLDMANVSTNGHVVTEVIKREMGSGTKFRNGDTLLARITPCLENGKTAFVDFLESDSIGWGSTEFVVLRPKAPLPEYHGYLLARYPTFREFAIQSMSGTSGRQRIQNDVLGRYLLALPSNEIATAFGNVVECIQQKIAENHNQSKTLEAVRDTLLPRLISGQLRLNQAQEIMDEVEA